MVIAVPPAELPETWQDARDGGRRECIREATATVAACESVLVTVTVTAPGVPAGVVAVIESD